MQRNRQFRVRHLRAEADDALAGQRAQLQVRVALLAIGLQRTLAVQTGSVVGGMAQRLLDGCGGSHQPRALRAHCQHLVKLCGIARQRARSRVAERHVGAIDLDDEGGNGGAQARQHHAAAADPDNGVLWRQADVEQARISGQCRAQHACHHQQRAAGRHVGSTPTQPGRVQVLQCHGAAKQVPNAEQDRRA